MASDIRYYRRRACEEMAAATRAVTVAARDRRLQLVDMYIEHLRTLNVPSPFEEIDYPGIATGSAFAWRAESRQRS